MFTLQTDSQIVLICILLNEIKSPKLLAILKYYLVSANQSAKQ